MPGSRWNEHLEPVLPVRDAKCGDGSEPPGIGAKSFKEGADVGPTDEPRVRRLPILLDRIVWGEKRDEDEPLEWWNRADTKSVQEVPFEGIP